MFGLLRLPDFAKSLVPDLAFPNLTHLRVKVFQFLALGVGRHLDRALFRHERDLIIGVLIGRTVKHGTDVLAYRHVVSSPIWIEQDAIAVFRAAIGKRDQYEFPGLAKQFVDL